MINELQSQWDGLPDSEKRAIITFAARMDKKDFPKKRFTPPDVDLVAAYCNERGNTVNAQAFVDFYESKGWAVGRSKMKDWKACVRTWEQRCDNERDKQSSQQRKPSLAERATEARREWERNNPTA